MGGLFGRKKPADQFDPNLGPNFDPYPNGYQPGGYGGPDYFTAGYGGPGYPQGGYGGPGYYPSGYGRDPYGGLGEYGPYDEYDPTHSLETYYGGGMGREPNNYGGRYARGMNQMPGMSPWNYGNYYMGNTTMQIMPFMMRKVEKYKQRLAMGGGGFGSMPMMPMMPMMPCLPAAAPMMAAATPLPIAFNPLVQGMYPFASMSPANWMTPASFMSALSTGPMPYRPPASFSFPNNVGMVMTVPYGTPNPLLSMPSFGGFSPQSSIGGGLSCCCCYCSPPVAAPAISYYPRPVSVPQPYPAPYPVPVGIPNIQQVPVPRPVTVVAPPIVLGGNQGFPVPSGAPLLPSQGAFTQTGFGQTSVMGSNRLSTTSSLLSDQSSQDVEHSTRDASRRLKAQRIAASLSNLGLDNYSPRENTRSKLYLNETCADVSVCLPSKTRVCRSNSNRSHITSSRSHQSISNKSRSKLHSTPSQISFRSHRQSEDNPSVTRSKRRLSPKDSLSSNRPLKEHHRRRQPDRHVSRSALINEE